MFKYTPRFQPSETAAAVPRITSNQSITAPAALSTIRDAIESLFLSAARTVFKDGTESDFSRSLVNLVLAFRADALAELLRVLSTPSTPTNPISEALRWLGLIDRPETHRLRLSILVNAMHHPSPQVRDAALLGISFLGDRDSIPDLEEAAEHEALATLKEDIKQVISDLYQA